MTSRSHLTALPNLLTYGRIVAIPIIVWCALSGPPALRWLAFVLYVAAAISDYFDGYYARKWQIVSPLGRMLDPIADKLLIGALIVALAFDHSIGPWELIPAIAILVREIFVSGLREFMGAAGIVVHVTKLAKWKTTAQLVALGAVLLLPLIPGIDLLARALLWLAGILTVWTGWEYFHGAWPHLRGDDTP
ncbi:MAG TPA: CDP-diacylglycerol--glycerol-3-phosphate 3-phosphatidyltransferase [Devosiaceae bacterium]|jgi:CDP-diacylglycerol--glycerol-3-phosphate 3-phosphatidyltransferase